MHDVDTTQPRRRSEAGQVGRGSPPDTHHEVVPREVGLPHLLPQPGEDSHVFALLRIRHPRNERSGPCRGHP